ncbi:NAD-dependent epimerase/dehydratase family protein [Sphingomonas naphthae]|uniref:NAD-dependent epimerase/dehydratase family protein n=1 Tax=Sphingomonas naphthae TaxID=1813468 RepID=A0ABY7TM28_9SPHN|nr:NAD-dependent epimerase/dehydratase family protein [Sphingomonas naphthae]WCT72894.1 NAD-dependent epimerase/dehydratase family protein [Sphingomonas naphthae]
MAIVVTGAAGFIGAHVCRHLLARGERVVGVDSLDAYYPVRLKHDRLAWIRELPEAADAFAFHQLDFADEAALEAALAGEVIDRIVHLGAQAGVRYSLENPRAYVRSNLVGHVNLLEVGRALKVRHLVYASSSSVYGANASLPFRVEDRVDNPVSLYAATKRSDELMSETYAHLYRLPQTGLRFFTVYGPWGRPDMAPWLFTAAILKGEPIRVFNEGKMRRDFTYIDDIVAGIVAALDHPPADDGAEKAGGSRAPHRLYNIGNNRAEELGDFIAMIERACGREAIKDYRPMQPGDVPATYADISAIQRDTGYAPTTPIAVGIPRFVDWYRTYTA